MTRSLCFSKARVLARRPPLAPVRMEPHAENRRTTGFKGTGGSAVISEAPLLNKDSQPLLFVFPSRATPLPLPPYYVLRCLRHLHYGEVSPAPLGHGAREVGSWAFIGLGALSQPSCSNARGPWSGQLGPMHTDHKPGVLSGFSVSSFSECSRLPEAGPPVTRRTGEAEAQS